VNDLRATRKGDKVTLTWSRPRAGTDPRAVSRVCRNISSSHPTASSLGTVCAHPVGEVGPQPTTGAVVRAPDGKSNSETTVRVTDTLPENPAGADQQFAVYTVEVRDNRGHIAGFSNSVWVPLVPILQPTELHSELDARGVYLIWQSEDENQPSSVHLDYRIYRREKPSSHRTAIPYLRAVIHTRDGDRWSGIDTNIEWEKSYSYWVTPVAKVFTANGALVSEVEGEDSPPIEITTHDIFPPAVPEKLLAVVSQIPGRRFVDLIWSPNTEKDLAGYNIYRRKEGEEMVRINSAPITMLSFQDTTVAAGNKYLYCISAVDLRENESAKSQEITATLR
jgi:hypothetical protein